MVGQRIRRLAESFGAASRGIAQCAGYGRNYRIHLTVALYVCASGLCAGFGPADFALIFVCFALVIGGEMFNTAIELSCDRSSQQYDEVIRAVKDIAAGGVLVCAVLSAAVGILLFTRPAALASLGACFTARPWLLIIFIGGLVPAISFINRKGRKK